MHSDDDRIRHALEALVRTGLLAREPAELRPDLTFGATGYRFLAAFWAGVGAVPPGADGFEQQATTLRDPFARANLHHRIVAAFLEAGAPLWWTHDGAGAAFAALRRAGDGGTRDVHLQG